MGKDVRSSLPGRGNPPGISVIRTIRGKDWSFNTYSYVVLLVTFIAYACYHASRKPSSIVKSVLDPEPNNTTRASFSPPWPIGDLFIKKDVDVLERGKYRGWEPFNDKDGTLKLGVIDVAFLACYAFAMYFAGHVADSWDLRLFLTTGMIGSGIFVGLFGVGYFCNVHVFWFYLFMQMFAGLFQSTGWPTVVAVVGHWFGKKRRGLIMGVWNAHTSVGNICGSLLAACVLEYGWGWSFIVPGGFIFLGGIMVFLFLPAYPEDVGYPSPNDTPAGVEAGRGHQAPHARPNDVEAQRAGEITVVNEQKNVERQISVMDRKSIGFVGAWKIPGVRQFAFCLLFAKLVAYTFLYWLPFYLSQTAIEGEYVSVKSAGNLSTLFDVGGIVGGILAGYISDKLKARAITAAGFVYAAIPAMILYRKYGSMSRTLNIVLMIIAGLFVNGPYALITTAVSADLGTHKSLRGDSRALATVTAIIDGTGSIGAAAGPLLTGFFSRYGWNFVFGMLITCAAGAGLCLSHLVGNELHEKFSHKTTSGQNSTEAPASQPLLRDQR